MRSMVLVRLCFGLLATALRESKKIKRMIGSARAVC